MLSATRAVPPALGRHLDDLAPDQLDPVTAREDAHLAHVADNAEAHRSRTAAGVRLFIVD